MKVEITYPQRHKKRLQRNQVINWAKWPFLFAAYICPVINLLVGGSAWSVIVLWSLYMVWTSVFAITMVEYNRISQFIKVITQACILLILIDLLLVTGWAVGVVPIVCFGGLMVAGVLFFTDLDRQRHNMMPLLLLAAVSLVCSVAGLIVWRDDTQWALGIMGAIAFALIWVTFSILGVEFIRIVKKHFHA